MSIKLFSNFWNRIINPKHLQKQIAAKRKIQIGQIVDINGRVANEASRRHEEVQVAAARRVQYGQPRVRGRARHFSHAARTPCTRAVRHILYINTYTGCI